MRAHRIRNSGFTLVEILIVVIILGILAAIVIPQFTNASQDARKNSLTSQLQTIRGQTELYKLQHRDQLPPSLAAGGASPGVWIELTGQTDADHAAYTPAATSGPFGPYLQQPPSNPLNGFSNVGIVMTDLGTGGGANPGAATDGWLFNPVTGKVWATSAKAGFVYDESDAANPDNDN